MLEKNNLEFPKVSIGIPVYNSEQFIEECIMSVVQQDYPNLEILVSDDCSSDNSFEIIKKICETHEIKYSRNKTNIGMVANYKKLLFDMASGDWYLNLDGDDVLAYTNVITLAIQALQAYPEKNVVLYSGIMMSSDNPRLNNQKSKPFSHTLYDGLNYFKNKSIDHNFSHGASLYNRSLALELNFYSEGSTNTDFLSLIKLCFQGNLVIGTSTISYWRRHNENQTYSVTNSKDSTNVEAIHTIKEYSKKYISEKEAVNWEEKQLEVAEWYRLVFLKNNQGFIHGIFSHFDKNDRLIRYPKLSIFVKFILKWLKDSLLS